MFMIPMPKFRIVNADVTQLIIRYGKIFSEASDVIHIDDRWDVKSSTLGVQNFKTDILCGYQRQGILSARALNPNIYLKE